MSSGRPRSAAVDHAIHQAALDLTVEHGYRGVTMEGIAARSGVAKQTIYRRYRSKGEVILDALATDAEERLPVPDQGSLRRDLTLFLQETFQALRGRGGQLNRALVTEALQDEAFADLFRQRHIRRRREAVAEILHRAQQRGEASYDDADLLIDLVFGPMWYRLLIGHGQLDDEFAAAIAGAVVRAAAVPVPQP